MNSVMGGLATVGRPTGDGRDSSILEGVERSMELLCEPSPRQLKVVGDTVLLRDIGIKANRYYQDYNMYQRCPTLSCSLMMSQTLFLQS